MSRSLGALAAALIAIACVVAVAAAAVEPEPHPEPERDAVLAALEMWTRRSAEDLRLEGAPPPRRVVTAAFDSRVYTARASFGALLYEASTASRPGSIEVVVGDGRFDSSRYEEGTRGGELPAAIQELSMAVDDADLAMARDLWAAGDLSYKSALRRWQGKLASMGATSLTDRPPDWSSAEPAVDVDLSPIEPPNESLLRSLAIEASAALWDVGGLEFGDVMVSAVNGRYYTVTSEGTRLVQPEGYAVVHAVASLRRGDGVRVQDELQWVAAGPSDLPHAAELIGEVRDMARSVLDRAAVAPVEFYEGPVIFEGRAAGDFLRYLLAGEISGTPPVPRSGRSYQQQTRQGPRVGRRVLPTGWTVLADPGRAPRGMAGGYRYDREGVLGQRVELVRDGHVRDLLMSRVPRLERSASNGHARGSVTREWTARPAVWKVQAARPLSRAAFDRAAARARHGAGLERILVVRRMGRGRDGSLPAPTHAVWRHADGREEPVLSLEFQNVDRRTPKDIAAASGETEVFSYLAPWEPQAFAARDRGLPTVLGAPARLVVEDLELVFPGSTEKPPALPPPERGSAGAANGIVSRGESP